MLQWKPLFTLEEGLERAIPWYRELLAANVAEAVGMGS
jgi:nucleoside-diphosphate-sugar epimerase